MDDIARKALEGSIGKWEAIVAGTGVDHGANDCPLCAIYLRSKGDLAPPCGGCPVLAKTESPGCYRSPYEEWNGHHFHYHPGMERRIHCPECTRLAQAELDFLRGLREP